MPAPWNCWSRPSPDSASLGALDYGRGPRHPLDPARQLRKRRKRLGVIADRQPRQVIRGWEQAVLHMKEGGTYQVAIPSALGYREHGRPGQVPPHATLLFEIEILEVHRAANG